MFTFHLEIFKGALSDLRQFLTPKNPLRAMRNAFYLTLKPLIVSEIFPFLLYVFGHVGKLFDKKAMVNLKVHDVTNWITNNYNTHTARYLKK